MSRLFNLLDLILPDDDGLALNRSSRDDVFFIFCLLKKKKKITHHHTFNIVVNIEFLQLPISEIIDCIFIAVVGDCDLNPALVGTPAGFLVLYPFSRTFNTTVQPERDGRGFSF